MNTYRSQSSVTNRKSAENRAHSYRIPSVRPVHCFDNGCQRRSASEIGS